MAQSMILDLLKTPQQVREEQLNKLRERSTAQASLLRGPATATTALPGLLSQFAAGQMANQAVDLNQVVRRGLGAAGQVAGGIGRPQVAQALQQAALSPEERQAGRVQQAIRGMDPGRIDSMKLALERLRAAGAPQQAIMALSDRIREMEAASVAAPPETRELKIGDEIVTQQWTGTSWQEIARGPRSQQRTEVNIDTGGQDAFTKEVGERLGTAYTESLGSVDIAEKSLQNLSIMEDIINQGIITGPFAESRTAVEKILAQAGLVDGTRVANTEAYLAASAQQTLALLQTGAVGAGTGISDADREFLAKAAGGSIALTEDSIRRIININKTVARNVFNAHNQLVDRTRQVFPESKGMVQERYYPGQRAQWPDGTTRQFDPVQGWVEVQ